MDPSGTWRAGRSTGWSLGHLLRSQENDACCSSKSSEIACQDANVRVAAWHAPLVSRHYLISTNTLTHTHFPCCPCRQEKNPPAVVDPSWVTDSIEEGVLLPCVNYFLRDFKDLAQKQLPALFQPIASKQYSSTSSGGGSGGSVTPVLDTTTAENAPFQKPAFASKRGPDGNVCFHFSPCPTASSPRKKKESFE